MPRRKKQPKQGSQSEAQSQRKGGQTRSRRGKLRGAAGKCGIVAYDNSRFTVALPDDLVLHYAQPFAINIPSNSSPNGRYFVMVGGAYRSEQVGLPSSLTLPNTSYFGNAVIAAASYYRWVEIEEVEFKFVPASFHVGSSWVGFGRNQATVTDNESGYSSVADIINGPNVAQFEYDEPFAVKARPKQWAKDHGALTKLKSGLITNPDDFQYEPQASVYLTACFSKPQGVLNPGTQTYLGDVYMRWTVRFSGRLPI